MRTVLPGLAFVVFITGCGGAPEVERSVPALLVTGPATPADRARQTVLRRQRELFELLLGEDHSGIGDNLSVDFQSGPGRPAFLASAGQLIVQQGTSTADFFGAIAGDRHPALKRMPVEFRVTIPSADRASVLAGPVSDSIWLTTTWLREEGVWRAESMRAIPQRAIPTGPRIGGRRPGR